jgi:glycosylphosphatidylinositol transamidase
LYLCGRLIEGVMRSVNNLLEKFHQSFFLYLLSAPNKFISVGVYMIPLGLLLLTLPLGAAALCSQSVKTAVASDSLNQTERGSTDLSSATPGKLSTEVVKAGEREPDNLVTAKTSVGSWQRAVVVVSVVQLWASLTANFPPFVSQLVDSIMMSFSASSKAPAMMKFFTIPGLKMFMWATMAIVSLLTMVSFLPTPGKGDWIAVKALLLGVATIGLGVMSQIDFAVSLVGALVLVPMSLCACPLTNIWEKSADEHKGSKSIQFRLFLLLGTMVNIIGSPPVLLASAMYFIGDSSSWQASLSKFWEWTELLWCWGSALYPYILVVHLPCSILCIYILLS